MRARLADVLVLFDWNGTIVDDAERARRATNQVLDRRGLPTLTPAKFTHAFLLPLDQMFRSLGVIEPQLATAEEEWNIAMSRAVAHERTGTPEMLRGLRSHGARLGVVSAAGAEAVESDLNSLRLDDLMDTVTAGAADKHQTLIRRRSERDHAVYVGDTEYDITCALRAGFVAIAISGGYCTPDRLAAAGAHAVINQLSELVPLITSRSIFKTHPVTVRQPHEE